jgi:hypothetical protein
MSAASAVQQQHNAQRIERLENAVRHLARAKPNLTTHAQQACEAVLDDAVKAAMSKAEQAAQQHANKIAKAERRDYEHRRAIRAEKLGVLDRQYDQRAAATRQAYDEWCAEILAIERGASTLKWLKQNQPHDFKRAEAQSLLRDLRAACKRHRETWAERVASTTADTIFFPAISLFLSVISKDVLDIGAGETDRVLECLDNEMSRFHRELDAWLYRSREEIDDPDFG